MTTTTAPEPTRFARVRRSLSRGEWLSLGSMAGFVALLHVVGWGMLIARRRAAALPDGLDQVFGVGLGVTAYTLGMRHAFDADHIAAIDNTTRKLMAEGKRPLSVGFWFSLGHSSDRVRPLPAARRGRARAGRPGRDGRLDAAQHDRPDRHQRLRRLPLPHRHPQPGRPGRHRARCSGQMRHGAYDEAALEDQLNNRGFMNRILGGATQGRHQAVADVPGRAAVRSRLRHGDRGRPARARRRRGRVRRCPGTRSSRCRSCSRPA